MRRLLLLVLLASLLPRLASAGDGSLVWRTLRAPGLQVHFPSQLAEMAHRVADTFADARASYRSLFPYQPRLLHITLDDYGDSANGFATMMPFDHMHFQAYPPEIGSDLADHGDWIRALVFHEYTHILHLGEVSGVPAASHYVLGRRWFPNQLLPRFFVEGLATYAESRHTGRDLAVAGHGGRIDSAQFMALLRGAVLDGTLPTLPQVSGEPVRWPRGNSWYLFGSLLVDDLVQTYGHGRLVEFIRVYGERMIPYGINGLAREVYGHSLERLWSDAKTRLTTRVQADWREMALDPTATGGERMTFDGESRGRIRPGTQPGTVVVAHAPKDGLARIEEIDVGRNLRRVLHVCQLDCDEPLVTPDGKWLLFTESRRFNRLYLFRELVAVALPAKATAWRPARTALANPGSAQPAIQLTFGDRVRSPSVTPDGRHVLFAAVRYGRTELRAHDLPLLLASGQQGNDKPQSWLLIPAPPLGETLDGPVALGDASGTRTLAWTHGQGAGRGLATAPLDATCHVQGSAKPIDLAGCQASAPGSRQAGVPSWIGDVHALPSGALSAVGQFGSWRVPVTAVDLTHWCPFGRTATGVVSVTHAAGRVVAVEHRGNGLEISALTVVGAAVPTAPAVVRATDLAYAPTPLDTSESSYLPFRHWWPRAWYPLLSTVEDGTPLLDGGLWVGAAIYGQDALSQWNWSLLGQMRSNVTDPVVLASLITTRWEPTWQLDGAYQQGYQYFRHGYRFRVTPTHRIGLRFAGAWQVPGLRDAWTFDGAVRLVRSSLRFPSHPGDVPYDPGGPEPIEAWTGLESLTDLGLSYTKAESYPTSLIPERLHYYALHGTFGARQDGTGERVLFVADTAHDWPLGHRRVLAMSGHLAWQAVTPDLRPAWTVHGLLPLSAAQVLGPLSSGIVVRGASGDGDTLLGGNGAAWGTASVHLPLADLGRGMDVLPVYARRLSLVPFSDVAYAFLAPRALNLRGGALWSLGAELRLDYDVQYALRTVVRLGFAHAFGEFGGTAGYFTVGL